METQNEQKARELAIKYCKDIDSNGKECYNVGCEIACNEAMEWKDEQATYDSWYLEELKERNKFYQEFIKYLYEDCAGSKDLILRAITENSYNGYIGYVDTEKSIDDNGNLIFTFKVDDNTYKAHWQQSDNYACCQWTGYAEDDYKGYLLFPTHDFKKFFCIYYEC